MTPFEKAVLDAAIAFTDVKREAQKAFRTGLDGMPALVKTNPVARMLADHMAAAGKRLEQAIDEYKKQTVIGSAQTTRYIAIRPRDQMDLPGSRLVIERQEGESTIALRDEIVYPERVKLENAHRADIRELIFMDQGEGAWVFHRLGELLGL